jgi:hypothetical protein
VSPPLAHASLASLPFQALQVLCSLSLPPPAMGIGPSYCRQGAWWHHRAVSLPWVSPVPSWQPPCPVQQKALACIGKGLCARHGPSHFRLMVTKGIPAFSHHAKALSPIRSIPAFVTTSKITLSMFVPPSPREALLPPSLMFLSRDGILICRPSIIF